jgi:DNA-directed RNA polymerase subunit RPC12/RpoP
MEKQMYAVGARVEKECVTCGEERGHVVVSVTKRKQVSRVECPKCGTRSSFKSDAALSGQRTSTKAGAPYDRTRTYRTGQTMLHPAYGLGEVTAIIEPQKIDVLFSDRLRRLIHARASETFV